ncbi:MAG: peptidase M4 [Pyrinomonadaceae bacterium]
MPDQTSRSPRPRKAAKKRIVSNAVRATAIAAAGVPGLFLDSTAIPPPATRPLKAYAFDPSLGHFIGNEMTIEVKYEKLLPGPVGRKVAVIDYDGANKCFYKPVDLDDPSLLIRGGLAPSESDPRFHQQMVYAVVSDTVQHFEAALGRRIRWRRGIDRLNLYPHAMISANAAYSPSAQGILFGYFRASDQDPGRNLPGQTVFTCLSHDIIVHETTHAVLDGIRTHFSERTNPDVPAFHEAFADLAALFRHFSHKTALLDTIAKTGGLLYRYHLQPESGVSSEDGVKIQAQLAQVNPLIGLAQQFGEARGTGKALRSALSEEPDPKKILDPKLEPHQRGAIMVSAVFDAYFTIYLRRTADLFRLYRANGAGTNTMEVSGSLANLLAEQASRTAEIFFQICVRAIDYCPPVDITFGDFLRAVITADRDLHPEDKDGIRDAFMQAFRLRGMLPADAEFFSEDALCWPRIQPKSLPAVDGLVFGDPNGLTREEKDINGPLLRAYAKKNAGRLGFWPDLPVEVPSFHPAFRISPDGRLRVDMVIEMVQQYDTPFDPNRPELGTFPMRAGCTVLVAKPSIVDDEYAGAEIRYLIQKKVDADYGGTREQTQRQYTLSQGLLEGNDPKRFSIDFNMLHGGI